MCKSHFMRAWSRAWGPQPSFCVARERPLSMVLKALTAPKLNGPVTWCVHRPRCGGGGKIIEQKHIHRSTGVGAGSEPGSKIKQNCKKDENFQYNMSMYNIYTVYI